MSFHAYLRKLTGGADKLGSAFIFPGKIFAAFIVIVILILFFFRGKFAALENISCKIKAGCEGHPPWPEGICTKCQPSAITLNRQVCNVLSRAAQVIKDRYSSPFNRNLANPATKKLGRLLHLLQKSSCQWREGTWSLLLIVVHMLAPPIVNAPAWSFQCIPE